MTVRAGDTAPRLLVVEDEFLIALDLEHRLSGLGYGVLGPAPSVPEACRLLDRETPDAAVLDVALNGELVVPVAEKLRAQRIPYLLLTAYSRSAADPPALAEAPRVSKPVRDAVLERALCDLLV